MFVDGTCDVCLRQRQIGVASLPFAPMSVAFCRECLTNNAYPLWTLHAAIELGGGKAAVGEFAQWFRLSRSYYGGAYIGFDRVLALYMSPAKHRRETKRFIREEIWRRRHGQIVPEHQGQ